MLSARRTHGKSGLKRVFRKRGLEVHLHFENDVLTNVSVYVGRRILISYIYFPRSRTMKTSDGEFYAPAGEYLGVIICVHGFLFVPNIIYDNTERINRFFDWLMHVVNEDKASPSSDEVVF